MLAATSGFPVAKGGAGSISDALLARVREGDGELRCDAHVDHIVVRDGRAVAVSLDDGTEIEAKRAIIADVGAPSLYLKMLDERLVPSFVRSSMKRFPYAWGTFKLDWALDAPVPWSHEDCARSAVVHLGDSLDDLATFTAEARSGKLPSHPYAVVGQSSLCDPSRAPEGKHTLYAYTHVPSRIDGGWASSRDTFADVLEKRIEELAPGFRKTILARAIHSPDDLEAMNENLVGGDLGGGSAAITNQLVMRPVFPYFRYRTPVRGLYLGSAYTHPGTGVHGACGANAALAAIEDEG
jgi:phytoene dehydrogenase-like protein